VALERRARGELSPVERAVRRKNRRWMSVVLLPSLLIGVVALIATVVASSSGPSVHPRVVPPGFRAVSDGFFAYAVPSSWSQSSAYTDNVGDLDNEGRSGWVGEHVGARPGPPVPGEAPPAALAAFGEPRPLPYRLGPATPIQVSGASLAYRYSLTRPGGFEATLVDAWQSGPGAEIWILIRADAPTTATVLSSLNG
jgi:hypothetical protein